MSVSTFAVPCLLQMNACLLLLDMLDTLDTIVPGVDHSQLRSVAEPIATSVAAHELYSLAPLAETAEGLQIVAAGEGHRLYVRVYVHFIALHCTLYSCIHGQHTTIQMDSCGQPWTAHSRTDGRMDRWTASAGKLR